MLLCSVSYVNTLFCHEQLSSVHNTVYTTSLLSYFLFYILEQSKNLIVCSWYGPFVVNL